MQREAKGIIIGIALLVIAYVLLYLQSVTVKDQPIASSFLGDVSTPVIAAGFGSFYLGFKTRIDQLFNPKVETKTELLKGGGRSKERIGLILAPSQSTSVDRGQALVRAIGAGFVAGAVMIYVGLQLVPIIPKATSPYWAVVPFTSLGGGIALILFGMYTVIRILRFKPSETKQAMTDQTSQLTKPGDPMKAWVTKMNVVLANLSNVAITERPKPQTELMLLDSFRDTLSTLPYPSAVPWTAETKDTISGILDLIAKLMVNFMDYERTCLVWLNLIVLRWDKETNEEVKTRFFPQITLLMKDYRMGENIELIHLYQVLSNYETEPMLSLAKDMLNEWIPE